MKRFSLKPYMLATLGLCFAGLIVFGTLYYLKLDEKRKEIGIHYSAPMELDLFETAFKFPKKEIDLTGVKVTAGVIPHHLLAADLIAEFFNNLENKDYDTIVLIGPNHFEKGDYDIISSRYDWQTPYGVLESDLDAYEGVIGVKGAGVGEEVIAEDHSINSLVSFVKRTFPRAEFLPVILKYNADQERLDDLVGELLQLQQKKKILVLASVDFSHYQDSPTAQKNDQDSIRAIQEFDFDKLYSLDIDSPASIYTLLKYGQLNQSQFELLNNSNSAILSRQPELKSTTSYVTGYFLGESEKVFSFLPENQTVEEPVRMLFFGDMMLDRAVGEKIKQNNLDYIFGGLKEAGFYNGYDLISANLEGAVTSKGEHYLPDKLYDFAFSPELMKSVGDYGFNFFNLANNHFDDQGSQGMNETRENLDALGLDYTGCQNGIAGECSATIVELKHKKIGMVGLSAVGVGIDFEQVQKMIEKLEQEVDLIVVNIHWGEEYQRQFNNSQQRIGHKIIDAGADIIIGHHPHVVQGVEIYRNRIIFYSLGNFVFDQYFSSDTQEGLAIEAVITGNNFIFRLYPLQSAVSRVNLMDEQAKHGFLQELAQYSAVEDDLSLGDVIEIKL